MTATMILQVGLIVIMLIVGIGFVIVSANEGKDHKLERHNRKQRRQENEAGRRTNQSPASQGAASGKVKVLILAIVFVMACISAIGVMIGSTRTSREEESDPYTIEIVDGDEEDDLYYTNEYYDDGAVKTEWSFEAKSGRPYSCYEYTPDGHMSRSFYYVAGEVCIYYVYSYPEINDRGMVYLCAEFDEENELTYLECYIVDEDGDYESETIDTSEWDSYEIEYGEDGRAVSIKEK